MGKGSRKKRSSKKKQYAKHSKNLAVDKVATVADYDREPVVRQNNAKLCDLCGALPRITYNKSLNVWTVSCSDYSAHISVMASNREEAIGKWNVDDDEILEYVAPY